MKVAALCFLHNIVTVKVIFLDNSVQGESAMRLTLCEAPTHETMPDQNTRNYLPYSFHTVRLNVSWPQYVFGVLDCSVSYFSMKTEESTKRPWVHLGAKGVNSVGVEEQQK